MRQEKTYWALRLDNPSNDLYTFDKGFGYDYDA